LYWQTVGGGESEVDDTEDGNKKPAAKETSNNGSSENERHRKPKRKEPPTQHTDATSHAGAGETQEKQAEARQENKIERRLVAGTWIYTIDGPLPAVSDYQDICAQWTKKKEDRKSGLALGPIDTGSPENSRKRKALNTVPALPHGNYFPPALPDTAITRPWTADEDGDLTSAVVNTFKKNLGNEYISDSNATAVFVQGRTKRAKVWCLRTRKEDIKLKEKDWETIAALVPGRTTSQCRYRWYSALDPKIDWANRRKGFWAEVEDADLTSAFAVVNTSKKKLGNEYNQIRMQLPFSFRVELNELKYGVSAHERKTLS
jgi:hypothetical protein